MFYMLLTIMLIFMSIECYLPSFMNYFKLQKLEFKKLIDDMAINL